MRQLLGITCCVPMTPELIKLQFWYFKPYQVADNLEHAEKINWRDRDHNLKFNTRRLVYVINAWLDDWSRSKWLKPMINAFTQRGDQVIFVDWTHGSQYPYFQAVANLRVVGMAVGFSIVNWDVR